MGMDADLDVDELAATLLVSVGLLRRRLRQLPDRGGLTLPEISALARLDRTGPTTSSALARLEQISPQSMGATLGSLEAHGYVERRPDPTDGRRVLLSASETGLKVLRHRRSVKAEHLARAMAAEFTAAELGQLEAAAPLVERLARSV
jgi:DNA-binding MarR family transcriptional regulator